jgi:hypothetical protein
LINNGLAITPKSNLITNIGFGEAGTHALSDSDSKANLTIGELIFPLKHPLEIKVNKQADEYNWKFVFRINKTGQKKIKSFLRHWMPELYGWMKKIKYNFRILRR